MCGFAVQRVTRHKQIAQALQRIGHLQQGAFSIRIVGDAEVAGPSADVSALPTQITTEKGSP